MPATLPCLIYTLFSPQLANTEVPVANLALEANSASRQMCAWAAALLRPCGTLLKLSHWQLIDYRQPTPPHASAIEHIDNR